ncbi:hypothetical protein [Paenibacillus piri]|uniref:hypothetical protein n=1 Tax=Paenibacillus piri TaxID=2547395 RepID=UPI0015F2AF74|nr:hypothetical protein [Paenibacillus piri]
MGQVTERLPLGTAGICNPASYNYAMIALFGNQKGRDYYQLDSPALREAFTEQANQSARDMKFYIKHANEHIKINPKFLKFCSSSYTERKVKTIHINYKCQTLTEQEDLLVNRIETCTETIDAVLQNALSKRWPYPSEYRQRNHYVHARSSS